MFAASPCASDSKPFSSASMASPRSIIDTTSASEIQSGANKDIFKKEIAAVLIWNGVGVAAEADRSHRLILCLAGPAGKKSDPRTTPNRTKWMPSFELLRVISSNALLLLFAHYFFSNH